MAKHETVVYETALQQVELSALTGQAIQVDEHRDYGFVVLRIRAGTAGASQALETLEITLPATLGISGSPDTRLVKWISPDEYLITLPLAEKDAFISTATAALKGVFSAVVDNSGGYSLLKLSGTEHLNLLSKITYYDIRGNLPPGKVVSTQLAKAPVIFYRIEEDAVMAMVRWSFADYAWQVLLKAGEEFGDGLSLR